MLCTNLKNEKEIKHKNIANQRIQERRARMDVPVGPGGKVHDYVPFYFSSINPMLLSKLIQKNVDQPGIIYFCVSIEQLEKETLFLRMLRQTLSRLRSFSMTPLILTNLTGK